MSEKTNLENVLRDKGLKVTGNRLAILASFDTKPYALSYADIAQDNLDMDKVTVYRTLKSFEELGLIHQVPSHGKQALYSRCELRCTACEKDHIHGHFLCTACERTTPLKNHHTHFPALENYVVNDARLILTGVCPDCARVNQGLSH